jgi:hypothetical protein
LKSRSAALAQKAANQQAGTPHTGAAKAGTQKASAAGAQSIFNQCANGTGEAWIVDRFEVCRAPTLWVEFRQIKPPFALTARLSFIELSVVYTAGISWFHDITLIRRTAERDVSSVVASGYLFCTGLCSTVSQNFPTILVAGGGDIHGLGQFVGEPAGNQAIFASSIWHVDFFKPNALPNPGHEVGSPRVRCDDMFSNRQSGCVFPDNTVSRFFLDSGVFPDVAEHVADSQANGAPGDNLTLHRAMNAEPANRARACPDAPRPAGKSCDEYPPASTREGAASAPNAGATFPRCNIDYLPDRSDVDGLLWSACMVSDWENLNAGVELNEFYGDNRVLDGDEFFFEIF